MKVFEGQLSSLFVAGYCGESCSSRFLFMKGTFRGGLGLDYIDGTNWKVRNAIVYEASNRNVYSICAGSRTDGASSRLLGGHINLLPVEAQNTPPAWLHDKHYRSAHVYYDGSPIRSIRRSEADWVFYDGLVSMKPKTMGLPRWRLVCFIAWAGVRLFGFKPWNQYRRHEKKTALHL